MTTLKELTHEIHVKAESHPFTKILLSGQVLDVAYATLLANQLVMYAALESRCLNHNLLNGIESICRSGLILQDLIELNQNVKILPSSYHFIKHIETATNQQLLAHVYVKHMGDLYGGQLIKTKVPGSCNMYSFDNRLELITELRKRLSTDMAAEAITGFQMTLNLFTEIFNEYYI